MLIFSGLIGVGGIILLTTSKAAELSLDLGPVNVKIKDQPAAQPAAKTGDLNGDGVIDTVDVSKFLAAFPSKDKSLDLNKDSAVDTKDLDLLLASYQP